MLKPIVAILSILCLLAGCSAPSQSARPQASAAPGAATGTVDTASTDNDDEYETMFIPPPVGSLLGGGSVRVAKKKISGTDEKALVGNINRLNAAAGTAGERPYVVSAVSRVTGVSERELQAQQDVLRLRFGELCAINAIARGDSNKVQEIATQRSKGRSWTELAQSNGTSIATVVKTAQNANDMTITNYSNSKERAKGGQRKMQEMGIRSAPRPQDG